MIYATVICATLAAFVAIAYGQPGSVHFTATIENYQDISGSSIIVYPRVVSNRGNAYNPSTGVFTATKGGSYLFSFYSVTSSGSSFWLDLYLNNEYVVSGYATAGWGKYATGGNSIALRLTKGDTVQLRSHRTVYLFAAADEIYSSFSAAYFG